MFLGWYDADRKYPTWRKLGDALGRYHDKFGSSAKMCMTSTEDAAELNATPAVAKLGIDIVGVAYIPRSTFYVGVEDIVMDETTVIDPSPAPVARPTARTRTAAKAA